MSYSSKHKDPRWQRLRLEILNRDKFACQACGATDQPLHVHHTVYARSGNPWDVDPDTLQTLCEACHEERTRLNRWFALMSAQEAHDFASCVTEMAMHYPVSVVNEILIFLNYYLSIGKRPYDLDM